VPGSAIPAPNPAAAAPPAEAPTAQVASLAQDGRGVARVAGKVVFIEGALPGEEVEFQRWRCKPNFDLANLTRVLRESSARVVPRCPYYDRCGGCSFQHLDPRAQVAVKQRVLEDSLARIGKVEPDILLSPLHGLYWGYRQRARLSVRQVAKKGGALVGFRERRAPLIVDMDSCEVLPPRISALIHPLRDLISELALGNRIPQIEVAVGDEGEALTLRVLDAVPEVDAARMRAFSARYGIDIYVQPGGPNSIYALDPMTVRPLSYRLPEFDLTLRFEPGDFTQVNFAVNRVLVRRAISLLEPRGGIRVADLFCGLGNFTLAIARRGASVVGVDGSAELLARAHENATRNGLAHRVQFMAANLFKDPAMLLAQLGPFDHMLIDPPRDGAQAVVHALDSGGPERIVYVSCNPATLARDAGILVHGKGYRLCAAGVVNMFPHTSHVESIALFVRQK
jgi:23S rRNA (uracil1939-C5)-methyltransferase